MIHDGHSPSSCVLSARPTMLDGYTGEYAATITTTTTTKATVNNWLMNNSVAVSSGGGSGSSVLFLIASISAEMSLTTSLDTAERMSSSSSKPTPLFIAPPTIAGLPVTTFSYIFLAVGGAAPILFIIVVVVSMKCYWWRKYRRYRRYLGYLEPYRDGADPGYSVRSPVVAEYQNSAFERVHVHAQFPDADLFRPRADSFGHDVRGLRYAGSLPDGKISASNPNVYFRETPLLIVNNGLHAKADQTRVHRDGDPVLNGTISSSAELTRRSSVVGEVQPADECQSQTESRRSLTSEEARVLACFDHIYTDVELNVIREPQTNALADGLQVSSGQENLAYDGDGQTDRHQTGRLLCKCNQKDSYAAVHGFRNPSVSLSDSDQHRASVDHSNVDQVSTSFRRSSKKDDTSGALPLCSSLPGVDQMAEERSAGSQRLGIDVDSTVAEHSYITCDNSDSQSEVTDNVQSEGVS